MTTREHLNRSRRRSILLTLPGITLFVGSIIVGQHNPGLPPNPAIIFVGFALFAAGLLLGYGGGRCLFCGERLGRVFSRANSAVWKIADDLQFCPFCGTSLDQDGDVPVTKG